MHSGPPHTTQLLSTYTPRTRGVITFIRFVLMPVKHTRKDVKLQQQGNKREMRDYKTWHDIQRAQMIHVVTWKEFMQQNCNRSDNRKVQKEATMRKCQSVEVAPFFWDKEEEEKEELLQCPFWHWSKSKLNWSCKQQWMVPSPLVHVWAALPEERY